jgi:enoyl-CoA hydratase
MTDSDAAGEILRDVSDGVLYLTLNRPLRLNAVTEPQLYELADAVTRASTDAARVRTIVLQGAGRAFCSGADLGSGGHVESLSVDSPNRVVRAIRDASLPVVAAVNGPAVGFGCSLALACDVVLIKRSAFLSLAFARVGLMPDGGATATVAASIGRARATRMALLGERISAQQAFDWGLASGIFDDGSFDDDVHALASDLAAGPHGAYAQTKSAINAATLDRLDGALELEQVGQELLSRSPDYVEGVTAFREGRQPVFNAASKPADMQLEGVE